MVEVAARRVNADGLLSLLRLRADSSAVSGNDRLRPFADIDLVPASTKMLPPRGLRRMALRAEGRRTTWGQAVGLRLKTSRQANSPSYL
jgi:hypothetical protein